MNTGTILRTILAAATSINMALAATDVTGFNNQTVDTIYTVLSVVVNFVIVALSTYFNNDYTEEMAQGTGYGRYLKAEKSNKIYTEPEFMPIEEVEDDE